MKILYVDNNEIINVAEIMVSGKTVCMEEALEIAGIDIEEFRIAQGWDNIDPECFKFETELEVE